MLRKTITPGLVQPTVGLTIGATGHRAHHPSISRNTTEIERRLGELFVMIERIAREEMPARVANDGPAIAFLSLLANGADLMAAREALARNWQIEAPLPFGKTLNLAINALPGTLADARALLEGGPVADEAVAARAAEIEAIAQQATLLELAERDEAIRDLMLDHLREPADPARSQAFGSAGSERAAIAAKVMIDRADLLIGVWDGVTRGLVGGTRHTIESALDQGVPVLWIDANQPERWQVLRATEQLTCLGMDEPPGTGEAALREIIALVQRPQGNGWPAAMEDVAWPEGTSRLLHAYRRMEVLFGEPLERPLRSLKRAFEHPSEIERGSGAAMLAAALELPGVDRKRAGRLGSTVLQPFAWADGISTWLSDAYRGGMVLSFFLSALAIAGGIAYLPLASVEQKWIFALFEFVLLAVIVAIFLLGKRRRWHERWFETRRIAEYFRHAPVLLLLGVSRSAWRWPRGADGNWPEWYVRHSIGALGLPRMVVTAPFLRGVLAFMRDHHVASQRAYHEDKARRLKRAQHNLHRLSESLFILAMCSVALYLAIVAGSAAGWLPASWPHETAKIFTFFGVLFPTMGGAFAGVHYFGDFERFAAISEITAEKLGDVSVRVGILLRASDAELTYSGVATIAHAIDDIVIDEIENWQAVFGGKHITVPV